MSENADEAPSVPRRRPTLLDVAERAGVSRSTTSRALTGQGYTARAVRERVRRAARELGYVPDAMARTLKQQVSHSIGVLVSDLRNPFYAELAAGVSQEARTRGYTMMLVGDGDSGDDDTGAAETFVAMRVAGVVVTPTSPAFATFLDRHRIPLVEVDRQFTADHHDGVVVNNRAGAREATEHLLALGHRRVALLIDETDWTTGRGRYEGYVDALTAAGVEVDPRLVVSAGWDVTACQDRAAELLAGDQRPTAVFAANNVLAEGLWRAVARLGLHVPGDVSLVAFDDASWMSMVTPGVTAVQQDSSALGAAAVRRLLERIDRPDGAPVTLMLGTRLVERGSTRALR